MIISNILQHIRNYLLLAVIILISGAGAIEWYRQRAVADWMGVHSARGASSS